LFLVLLVFIRSKYITQTPATNMQAHSTTQTASGTISFMGNGPTMGNASAMGNLPS
jgi:hypothetical protein